MTVNRTTLLDLPLPVTGTEAGTWGDTTNNGLSQYMDIAIAGMNSLTSANFTAGALTIANTQGDSSATNIAAGSAQYATIRVSSLAVNSTITAPSSNRSYRIINADATYSLTIKASGQTGVTFLPGQTGVVAFNGTDYVIVGVVGAGTATDNAVARFDGTTGEIIQNSVVTIADSTGDVAGVGTLTMGGNLTLSGGTANGVLYLNGSKVATSGSALTFDGTNLGVNTAATALTNYRGAEFAGTTANTGGFLRMRSSDSSINSLDFTDVNGRAIFTTTNHPVRFGVNDVEQMRLTSTGLGIGTSSPAFKLHVNGASSQFALISTTDTTSTTGILFGDSASNTVGRIEYVHSDNGMRFFTNGTTQATLDSSGNLGIGTSSPSQKLTVSVADAAQSTSFQAATGRIRFRPYVDATNGAIIDATNTAESAYIPLSLTGSVVRLTTNANSLLLDSSGNLGLGVTPNTWTSFKAFQISATGALAAYSGQTTIGSNWYYNTTDKYIIGDYATAYSQGSGQHRWYTAGVGTANANITFTQAMTLDASGNLGVGTTSPGSFSGTVKLVVGSAATTTTPGAITVYSGTATYGGLYFADGTVGDQLYRGAVEYNHSTDALLLYSAGTERARITSGGDLLVGKTSGTAKIDVESSANTIVVSAVATNASYTSNVLDVEASRNTTNSSYNFIAAAVQGVAYRFYVRDSGDVVNTNNSYGGISDIKVKENIVDASPKLADLQNVRIVNFNYKNDQTHKQIGVIAQELEQIFPSMVEEAPDRDTEGNDLGTTTKSVKYSVFVPMLIKAIQEQQALIESLTTRVATLEGTQP